MKKIGYYIYAHIRPDTNEIFYIGKGTKYDSTWKSIQYKRAYSKKRGVHWNNIVKKNNGEYEIKILEERRTIESINKLEQKYIARLGRRNTTLLGCLVNLTDGGDGGLNLIVSEKTRLKLSNKFLGENHPNYGKKLSKETCKRKSESMKNSYKNLRGKKLPKWWRDKISETKKGDKNIFYGKPTPISKKVINVITGEIFDSISRAEKSIGMSDRLLHQYLDGSKSNQSPFVYLEKYLESGPEECLKIINQPSKRTKRVINTKTGYIYQSVNEAAEANNMKHFNLRPRLLGKVKNETNLQYYNG